MQSIVRVAVATSKVVVATYRILATLVMGYYLIAETLRGRGKKDGRVRAGTGRGIGPSRGG
jgi:hypothetical protein